MIFFTLFEQLERLGLDFESLPEYHKSVVPGLMDLNYDYLDSLNGHHTFALSHYYKMNGDMVADPDMTIRVHPESRMAEALTYQDFFTYREVYPAADKVDPRAKRELNAFLSVWLSNLIEQGHSLACESMKQAA